jgi:hypothetical protein
MQQGAMRHADQLYPGRIFSEIKYLSSVIVGADSVVEFQCAAQGADAVFLHWLYWVPTQGIAATTWTVIDQFKQVLFQLQQFAAGVGNPCPYPITAVKAGPTVKIIVPSVGGNFLHFSISYQFLMIDTSEKKS